MLTVLICCFPMTYLLFSFHYDLYHKTEIHQYYSQDQIFQSTAQTISPTQHHTTQHSIHNTTQHHTTQHSIRNITLHYTTFYDAGGMPVMDVKVHMMSVPMDMMNLNLPNLNPNNQNNRFQEQGQGQGQGDKVGASCVSTL